MCPDTARMLFLFPKFLFIIENSNQSVISSVICRYQTKEPYSYNLTELNTSCHRQAGKTRYQNKIHLHCIYTHIVSFTTTNQKTRNVFVFSNLARAAALPLYVLLWRLAIVSIINSIVRPIRDARQDAARIVAHMVTDSANIGDVGVRNVLQIESTMGHTVGITSGSGAATDQPSRIYFAEIG